jgi:hypothetical protein
MSGLERITFIGEHGLAATPVRELRLRDSDP